MNIFHGLRFLKKTRTTTGDKYLDGVIEAVEKETGERVFTMRPINEEDHAEKETELLVVLNNREILHVHVRVDDLGHNKIGIRLQMNYL